MKIYIAGSMHFAPQMLDAQKALRVLGHEAFVPTDTEECVIKPELNMDAEHCFESDVMRSCFDILDKCDAMVVLNYPKNDIDGYIGGATLIELGLAYYLKKKVFLLFAPPPVEVQRYSHEVLHMRPVILNGDLSKIS